jgi:hypothetical protein
MNRMTRLLTLAATCACSLSLLADLAQAQGQPQPQGGGAAGDTGGRGARQPGNRGGNAGGNQPGGQRGGGGGGFGGGMFGGGRGMFEVSVSTEEMDRYGKMLNLSKSQSEAVKSLHDAYAQDFAAAAQKSRDEIDAVREEARDDPSRMQEIGELFTKFRAKRQAMETSFFNDVKATLTPEQQNVWPTVERVRRRETTMNRGLMSGERADLVKIVDGLKLAPEAHKPVEPILDQYQIDLDRELILRNEHQDKMQGNMRDLFTGGGDQAKLQKMIEEGRAVSTKLRDVNKRYARQVEAALPEDARAKFAEELRRESFPNIYRGQSYATRVAESAGTIEGLSAEQKTSITEIKDRYTRDLAALNQKMETAYEQRESTITAAELMGRFGGGGGPRGGGGGMIDSEELTTLREQRRDLETATVEKIQALLNEDQKAKLPQQRGGGGRGGDQGGGAGGANGGGGNGNRRNRPNNNQPAPAPNGRT